MKKIVITLSGGMDSAVLLYDAAKKFDEIYTITFDYNQRHKMELECSLEQLYNVRSKYPNKKFYNTKLHTEFIKDIAPTSSLTNDKIDNPNVKEVMGEAQPKSYVPFRNLMFISMILSHAEAVGASEVWYGAAQADSLAGYWDGSPEFVEAINTVTSLNREHRIDVKAPLIELSKKEIILKGIKLGVNFYNTYTCYSGEYPCDADTASSALRLKGFIDAGYRDPLQYKQQDKLEKLYAKNKCLPIRVD